MITKTIFNSGIFFLLATIISCSASRTRTGNINYVQQWTTKADETMLLQKKNISLSPMPANAALPTVYIEAGKKYQTIDGFGYTLTGGSATLINSMSENTKNSLLQELFGNAENSIGVNYLRVSVAASDLDPEAFSYNDLTDGETDVQQTKFSIEQDKKDLIPILKKILEISPNIKILASPWSPPAWMKTNNSTIGGSLKTEYYDSYALYLVKYIQAMQKEGIIIDALTPQNEPLHPGNNPSLYMTAEEQRDFIKNSLGPAFVKAGIKTKIIIYDHNLDRPDYPITILNDKEARKYIDGSAFHLYAGVPETMSQVHNAHPDKNLYFTEQWTGAKSKFDGDLQWHIKNVIIGTMNNWSKVALEWNLANDPQFKPHTPGGCTECKGALTIDGSNVKRNVSYYIIAHASKFVPTGSVRIASTQLNEFSNVAFLTPQGKIILIVLNEDTAAKKLNIQYKNTSFQIDMEEKSVSTIVI